MLGLTSPLSCGVGISTSLLQFLNDPVSRVRARYGGLSSCHRR